MKKILALTFITTCISTPAFADTFLYGNCKPVKDTGFYRCLSLDDQITYTNILPNEKDAAAYKKERQAKERARRLKAKQEGAQLKSDLGKTEVIVEAPKEQPKVEVKSEAVVDAARAAYYERCVQMQNAMRNMIDAWGDLALIYATGDRTVDARMSDLEKSIGQLIDDPCIRK